MKSTFLSVVALNACLSIDAAFAGSQALGEGQRWLTVASTRDVDTAKGIAAYYRWKNAKVMSSQSGWFAIVMGPFAATSFEALAKLEPSLTDLPKDAVLSEGKSYVDIVWEPPPVAADDEGPLVSHAPGQPVQFVSGPLIFKVEMTGDEDNPGPSKAVGMENGKTVFTFETGRDFTVMESGAGLLRLDPRTDHPQLAFTRYTGGAHCCTKTWIVTKPKDVADWVLVEAAMLDGNGYAFEDLNRDGAVELVSRDNRFLYAFDSYAGSFAPHRIAELIGASLQDTTVDPKWKSQWKQELGYMEFSAKLSPDLWNSNGFLVAWLAQKILIGDGEAAWRKVMENYDRNSDFGPSECLTKSTVADCPFDKLRRVDFPKAVAGFLRDMDYQPLPKGAMDLLE